VEGCRAAAASASEDLSWVHYYAPCELQQAWGSVSVGDSCNTWMLLGPYLQTPIRLKLSTEYPAFKVFNILLFQMPFARMIRHCPSLPISPSPSRSRGRFVLPLTERQPRFDRPTGTGSCIPQTLQGSLSLSNVPVACL
jgi:hypothetical protein